MSDVESYEPGTPCWFELATPDREAAMAFYAAIFGWEYAVAGPEAGFYTMPERRGRPLAGIMTQGDDERAAGVPPAWRTYVSVVDADATATRAAELGATVVAPPFDVLDVGRMCVLVDPVGAVVCCWQPRVHVGAGVANEPGAVAWSELAAADVGPARAFYAELFGWTYAENDVGGGYTEVKVGDRAVAGMMALPPEASSVPPAWLTYFAVDDCDRTAAQVGELGGAVLVPPTDIPPGRFAVLADPQGAAFAIITLTEPPA